MSGAWRRAWLGAGLVLALSGCASGPAQVPPGGFSFGLWGDMPYALLGDERKMPALLASLNASDIAFSIFDGDIKDGHSPCTDAQLVDTRARFDGLRQPLVYTPGDNEWTDCHRRSSGGADPLERLAAVRRLMYPEAPQSLGERPLALQRQGAHGQPHVENQRFSHGGVLFMTVHQPGSNNNLVLGPADCQQDSVRLPAQCEAANAEHQARDAANVQWLHEGFEQARAERAVGVVVAFQANPGFDDPATPAVDESRASYVRGYRRFMTTLADEVAAYPGQVLLVHGDTHAFKIDRPALKRGLTLPNLTRVETFGSPHIHWVRVVVDPQSAQVFRPEPVTVAQPFAEP